MYDKNFPHVFGEFCDEKVGQPVLRVDISHWEEIIVKQRNLL